MLNLNEREEKILQIWKEEHIVQKLKDRNKGKKKFYFLDGPPNAYGLATHHMWVYAIKDLVTKYKRFAGFDVHDRGGFDVHGLPIENKIERSLNLASKDEIETKVGVADFVKACKDYVDKEMVGSVELLKRVYVITSRAQSQKQNMAIGILQTRRKLVDFKAILIISIFLYLMFALNQFIYFAAGLVVLAIAILLWLKGPRSNLRLKVVTDKFIHEKLYISDDNAIVGSANLTYAGMHKNIEHIELINEQDKVNQLSEHFDELWSKY